MEPFTFAKDRPLSVGDLLDMKSWGLTLEAGEKALSRKIEWAHIFDITDPSAWLDGGELVVMTGRNWPSSGDSQVALVRNLIEANSSALALGLLAPELTSELVDFASRLGFPILRVPRETRYLEIVRFVIASNGERLHRDLALSLRVYESMVPTESGSDAIQRFKKLEKLTGYRLTVVSSTGRALFEGLHDRSEDEMEDVRQTEATGGKWKSLAIPGGFAAPVYSSGRRAGFVIATEETPGQNVNFSVFRAVETVAKMEIGTLYNQREQSRRLRSELLGRMLYLGGAADWQEQVDHRDEFVLFAIRGPSESQGLPGLDFELQHQLEDERLWNFLLQEQDRTVLVASAGELDRVLSLLGELSVTAGLSKHFSSLDESAIALRQALWALDHGHPMAEFRKILTFSRGDSDLVQWLPSDPGSLNQLVKQSLGEVLAYDKEKGTSLISTLQTYFEEDCRLQQAADKLFIHKHTLSYRLRRIEKLTGREMKSVKDRSVLWFALSALSVVSMFPESSQLIE